MINESSATWNTPFGPKDVRYYPPIVKEEPKPQPPPMNRAQRRRNKIGRAWQKKATLGVR